MPCAALTENGTSCLGAGSSGRLDPLSGMKPYDAPPVRRPLLTKEQVRERFMPRVRRAARRAVSGTGWKAGASGALTHPTSGHWGQVAFRIEVARDGNVSLIAGALSPYLMRLINKLDPARNPPPDFVAAHAQTEWFQRLKYLDDYSGPAVDETPNTCDPHCATWCCPDRGLLATPPCP